MQATYRLTQRRGNRRGGAILEMALVLGLLLNLTFGMVEFSYFFYVKNAFENAAREGVRAAMLPGGATSDATTAVTNALASYNFPANSFSSTVTDTSGNTLDPSTAAVGTSIQVNVVATWSTIGKGYRPLTLIAGTKQVTGYCVMQKE
ncbi:MAG TPA: TadE/TadG family type IV pilus assembly protein [Tepidisphaeraceae bacterium]|jgi:Flp pilus assembly protein TadG|nr:TadE/TadG family type IV pilus assembly protein [Tepidisphaeraceae bacterium]